MGLLLRQGAEQGLKARFMGPEGVGNSQIAAIAGPAVEGMLLTLPADFTKNPKNAAIVKAFKDKGRDPGGAFQMTSFAPLPAIVAGTKGVGAAAPARVAAYQ